MANIPAAEVSIDADLVRLLVDAQCPWLAAEPVERFAHGWDNDSYALGPDRLVRLPRRLASAGLIEHELAVLPRLAPNLPVPVPVPVFAGSPDAGYPWRWTVVPHLPGRAAVHTPVADRGPAAEALARFLVALHTPADADAPTNPYRGVPLAAKVDAWRPQVRAVAGEAGLDRWQHLADAPAWPGRPTWVHGDPHPLNVLLDADAHLTGVIDFGDVCAGDPASDLAVAWLLFDAPGRAAFRAVCDHSGRYDAAIWQRALAWALGLSCTFALHSDDQPDLAAIARHGLAEALADPGLTAAG